jgi:hypothetical protein
MSALKNCEFQFTPLNISNEFPSLDYAPLFVIELDGDIRHNRQKPDWNISINHVSMHESRSEFVPEAAIDALNLEYSIYHRPFDGIKLAIKTSLIEDLEPSLETLDQDLTSTSYNNLMLIKWLTSDEPSPLDEQNDTPNDDGDGFNPHVSICNPVKEHPLSKTLLNPNTACLWKGLEKTENNPMFSYPGLFFGIRILYDLSSDEIIHIRKDDGQANWYESPYDVIVYPTGLTSCPMLSVGIYLWVTDLSK